MIRIDLFVPIGLILVLVGLPAVVSAQGGSESVQRRVISLVEEGKQAYKAEKYETALQKFKKAYELKPSPSILVPMGRSAENLGRTEEALGYFRKFVEANPDKPAAEKVRERIARLEASLKAKVTVSTIPSGARVRLDGKNGRLIGTAPVTHELDAGTHTFYVNKDGYRETTREVTVDAKEEREVTVGLVEIPSETTSEPQATPEPDPESTPTRTSAAAGPVDTQAMKGWAYGSIGIGAAALTTGVILTVLKNGTENDVNNFNRGAQGSNPQELQDMKNQANSYYRGSVAAFAAGGALTAVGVGMLTYHLINKPKEGEKVGVKLQGGVSPRGAWAGIDARF
jgi:tetratricopeptide (TPR) repeat protein